MRLKWIAAVTIYIIINTNIIDEICNLVTFGKLKKIKFKIIILIFQFQNDSWINIHYHSIEYYIVSIV